MQNEKYLIGIDSGTSGIKAVVFNFQGEEICSARRKLEGITPYEDWYEEDMNHIWEKCCECLDEILQKTDHEKIVGIGITAQGDGLWMIDKNGNPIRPGMCFCDGRTGEIISAWNKDGTAQKAFEICGTAVFGSAMSAEIKWMEKYKPEELDRAAVFFHLKDWLFYKLTGVISCDDTDMSIPLLNAKTRQYDDELFRLFGLETYRDRFPQIRPTKDNKCTISEESAEKFELSEDVLIVGGPMDVPACALGSGAIHNGQAATTIGTAAIHSVIMDEPRLEPYMAGMTIAHCLPDRWIRLVSSLGGAPNLEWFLKNFGGDIRRRAEEEKKDIYDLCSEIIAEVPIGSNGVVYYPYLMAGGERAPFFKDNIKASFVGISFNTKTEDMLRAVYEGIAMAMVDCYSSVPTKLTEVYVSGGGAKSDVWMQMFADAMNTDVVISDGTEFGAKGAAINVGIALGIYKDYESAVEQTVREKKRFHPNMERHKKYRQLYHLYRKGYELNMPWWDMRSDFLRNNMDKEE